MAELPPPGDGDEPDSRDQRDLESMDVELALSAHALLSWEEEGEVHSDNKSYPEAILQGLFSPNAAVESSAGHNKQALRVAVAPMHAVPLPLVVQVEMCRPRGSYQDCAGRIFLWVD